VTENVLTTTEEALSLLAVKLVDERRGIVVIRILIPATFPHSNECADYDPHLAIQTPTSSFSRRSNLPLSAAV